MAFPFRKDVYLAIGEYRACGTSRSCTLQVWPPSPATPARRATVPQPIKSSGGFRIVKCR
jgi:hypothetical protein